jgi:S-adenosylmethionine hydrolase
VSRVVTLLTDYGPGSEHVGALHAVLASRCPGAARVDLAHDIPAGDVARGAVVLARLAPLCPAAVHVAVVDPGVGSARRALAVGLGDGGALVGPDNGLLALAAERLGATGAVELPVPSEAPATFHGRDVFAPAAVRLAAGEPLAGLGAAVGLGELRSLDLPPARAAAGRLEATVLGADRFGNLELLAGAEHLEAAGLGLGDALTVTPPGGATRAATRGRTFADVEPGALLVLLDASGAVALAVNRGDAGRHLGAGAGARVTLRAAEQAKNRSAGQGLAEP